MGLSLAPWLHVRKKANPSRGLEAGKWVFLGACHEGCPEEHCTGFIQSLDPHQAVRLLSKEARARRLKKLVQSHSGRRGELGPEPSLWVECTGNCNAPSPSLRSKRGSTCPRPREAPPLAGPRVWASDVAEYVAEVMVMSGTHCFVHWSLSYRWSSWIQNFRKQALGQAGFRRSFTMEWR